MLTLLLAAPAQASHIRAGDIQAKSDTTPARNPMRYFFRMVTYTDPATGAHADADETIYFGDGTRTVVTRQSQVYIGNEVYRNVYVFEHTFNAPGEYWVSHIGEYRNRFIRNMSNPSGQSFYIATKITISPLYGINRSPVLHAPAVDRAAINQVFLHNPAASDADGDSLAYRLQVSQQVPAGVAGTNATGNRPVPQPVPQYTYPHLTYPGTQVPYSGPPASTNGAAILDLNPRTGQLVWNAPSIAGEFNLAFVVEEWRRDGFGGRRKIGETIRDMQISVFATPNTRPLVLAPADVCVVAGNTVTSTVTATDPDGHQIRLQAYGGMLPPATFTQTQNQAGQAAGTFRWTTSCTDVASEPAQILFKAEDQPPGSSAVRLIDERVWRVRVVGPPPQNLQAGLQGNSTQLSWDRYFCQNASRIRIFRKEDRSQWQPDACETGIPASAGYVQIGEVGANLQGFLDDNGGRGLERGKTYCYRIYAEFPRPAGGASIASQEACVTLPGRSALLTNVTVDRTDATTGQITVKWTKPAPAAAFAQPAGYRLLRGEGQSPLTFTPVRTFNNLNDTVHVDTGLDTENRAYSYRLEFFRSGGAGLPDIVETAGPASSVRVQVTPNPSRTPTMDISWAYQVPWDNSGTRTRIYRKDPGNTTYSLLTSSAAATRTGGTFVDRDPILRLNATYCYRVETVGGYAAPQPQNLENRSQELCVRLAPRPCRPVLTLQGPDCETLSQQALQYPSPLPRPLTYTNVLGWTLSDRPEGCSASVVEYRVLYSATCDTTAFQEIGRTRQSSFTHANLASAAGCYRVLAVDSAGATAASNIAAGDNCRIFVLPNIFSPNNDQQNDTFRPLFASPVAQVRVQIFNRWGAKVYAGNAGTDLTLWDGGGARSRESGGRDTGAKAAAGTYYYLIEVEFADHDHTRASFKGWVEIMR
ncbi:hypothetical protein GCM10027048_00510 [Hymenobacter coalescens]